MTVQEAYNQFDVLSDKFGTDYFPPSIKDIIFRDAIYEFIDQTIREYENGKPNRTYVEALMKIASISFTSGEGNYPSDYYQQHSFERARITDLMILDNVLDDVDEEPTQEDPIIYFADGKIYVRPTSVATRNMRYWKKPTINTAINTSAEWVNLPEQAQMVILDIGVRLARNSTENPYYEKSLREQQENES